ncbi:MAG: hypothetical protein F6K19_46825 [Cyanothece sp. SIO1E1]|nr:hypothetical protein [Cyanothece sp. SIO1E1]
MITKKQGATHAMDLEKVALQHPEQGLEFMTLDTPGVELIAEKQDIRVVIQALQLMSSGQNEGP